jgi:methionine-gamma-lyase
MAAISSAVLALCNTGDHIVCSNCVYGGTFAFMKTYLPAKCGINVTFVDVTDTAAVAAAVTPKTKVGMRARKWFFDGGAFMKSPLL